MRSMQEDPRNARAEAAARQAANELAAKRESTGEENRGLLGSIQDGAKSLLSSILPSGGDTTPGSDAMKSPAWRADGAKQRAGEIRISAQKAEEYIGAAAEKAGECKEESFRTAEEAKQRAAGEQKSTPAEETKDYTADKGKESKDTVAGKLGKYKKSAVGVVRKATDFLTGKKEKVGGTAVKAEEKLGDTIESARQKKMEMDEEMRDYNKDDTDEEVAIVAQVIAIPIEEIEFGNPWARRSVRKETKVRRGKHLGTGIGEEVRSNSW